MVYKDPSTMINEITPENFDLFIARMNGKNGGVEALPVAKAEPVPSAPPMKGGRKKQRGGNSTSILSSNYKDHLPGLYNFVVIKDMISEFIWYVLVGNLVLNTSNSYVQSIKCKRSAGDLGAFVEDQLNNPKKEKKQPTFSLGY